MAWPVPRAPALQIKDVLQQLTGVNVNPTIGLAEAAELLCSHLGVALVRYQHTRSRMHIACGGARMRAWAGARMRRWSRRLAGGRAGGRAGSHALTPSHPVPRANRPPRCPADELILDAAEAAGVEMPFMCRSGTCMG